VEPTYLASPSHTRRDQQPPQVYEREKMLHPARRARVRAAIGRHCGVTAHLSGSRRARLAAAVPLGTMFVDAKGLGHAR
jgi:hypothetical protein